MAHKRTGKKCYADLRVRFVAKLPLSAIESVHEPRFARQNTNRHATRHHLTVGGQVRSYTKQRLTTTRMHTESGNHLIEYQGRTGLFCNLPSLLQEFERLQVWVATLDRLNQYRCQIFGVL